MKGKHQVAALLVKPARGRNPENPGVVLLDLLEELLQFYEGTVFLVSHDRTFLNNVVTSTIAYEGDGQWREYEGDVQDWLTQSRRSREIAATASDATGAEIASTPDLSKNAAEANTNERQQLSKKKLSYKDQRELDQLPDLIAALEAEQKAIQTELADGSIYSKDAARATALHARDGEIETALLHALERWSVLTD